MDFFDRKIKYFREVARLRSFSAASHALKTTQGNLSIAIAKLEEELGYTLFERSRRGATLTLKGEQLFIALSRSHQELLGGLEEETDSNEGIPFRLGVRSPTFSRLIEPNLAAIKKEVPLLQCFSPQGVDPLSAVAHNELDALIIGLPSAPRGNFVVEELYKMPIFVYGLAEKYSRIKNAKSRAELSDLPWAHIGYGIQDHWTSMLAYGSSGYVTNSLQNFREIILGGHAIGAGDQEYFTPSERKRLVGVQLHDLLSKGTIYLISKKARAGRKSDQIAAFQKLVRLFVQKYQM